MGTNTKKKRANIKQALFLVLFFVALLIGLDWHRRRLAEEGILRCHFEGAGSQQRVFRLEIASSSPERAKGLMFRRELAPDQGMLFIYPAPQKMSFWMKDTYVPLDMIFLDAGLKVLGILEDVPVNNEKSRSIDAEGLYAVELLAGSAKQAGIRKGSVLKCNGPLPRGL